MQMLLPDAMAAVHICALTNLHGLSATVSRMVSVLCTSQAAMRALGAALATSVSDAISERMIMSNDVYRLTFTSTSIAGKKMIIQATNTGADLGEGQFDLAIPGGGVGICKSEIDASNSSDRC